MGEESINRSLWRARFQVLQPRRYSVNTVNHCSPRGIDTWISFAASNAWPRELLNSAHFLNASCSNCWLFSRVSRNATYFACPHRGQRIFHDPHPWWRVHPPRSLLLCLESGKWISFWLYDFRLTASLRCNQGSMILMTASATASTELS